MPKKLNLCKEAVQAAYEELQNLHKVAERFGVSRPAIMRFMDKEGIPRAKNGVFSLTREQFEADYEELRSTRLMAKRYGVSKSVIVRVAEGLGFDLIPRPPAERLRIQIADLAAKGLYASEIAEELNLSVEYVNELARRFEIELNRRYHTGVVHTHNGYLKIRNPDSPDADSKGYVHVHRQLLADALGLEAIPKGMVVHHINGDKRDNRVENLELMTLSDHAKHHRDPTTRLFTNKI